MRWHSKLLSSSSMGYHWPTTKRACYAPRVILETSLQLIAIKHIQGAELISPFAEQVVRTTGVVTHVVRRGFFLQTPNVKWDAEASDAIFVYSPDWQATQGAVLEVCGQVLDYLAHDNAKPVTQIVQDEVRSLKSRDDEGRRYEIEPIELTQELLPQSAQALATRLNSLTAMLVSIAPGQTFIAPSNPFGDYVLALDGAERDTSSLRSEQEGVLIDAANPLRWFPGFRITNYNHAPKINVGAKLLSTLVGPLSYRVGAYQIAISDPFKVEPSYISLKKSALTPEPGSVTVMTLNCFNLDAQIESAARVKNPRRDIDDDWGEGRFHTLAQAVVLQANTPDIVALQEIQDSDGAEISEVVEASKTYELLIATIEELSGVRYEWIDIDPELDADGGQPGGNIRNGFLFNPARISLVDGSAMVFGADESAFENSRKPLVARFREQKSQKEIACINLHLASKRHQNSIFAPVDPGVDAKLAVRVQQASVVAAHIETLAASGIDYYVTGDFNDTEFSDTLSVLKGVHSANLVEHLPPTDRFDYNHRGMLQVLMHGIVSLGMAKDRAEYEIIHGNELIGVKPSEESDKPSDHAYVIAKLSLE